MLACFTEKNDGIPVHIVTVQQYADWLNMQPQTTRDWLANTKFKSEPGNIRLIPDTNGKVEIVICCVENLENMWCVGNLAYFLPEDNYRLEVPDEKLFLYATAWGLGAYQFTRYKKREYQPARLFVPSKMISSIENIVASIYLVRDYINTPTDDMGPSELSAVTKELAAQFNAQFTEIAGKSLLSENYDSIYTVGRASDDAPRLLDMRWGNESHPKITLVGKGVCFDSGGLDIKSAPHMLLMKKDMAGAAHVLGLARMIMQAKLPIRLRVLIPAVENVISGNAYRPGDIIKSRKGLTVEIGNTDAEGRVVLSDALTEAVSESPDLLIDITTLTGAARIALGTELPAVFSNNDEVVNEVIKHGEITNDLMWRLPLYAPYRDYLNSPIADLNNSSSEPYGGAITAALFLKEFVPADIPWLHFDLMAWNLRNRPGRPQGGEAMGIRALFSYLEKRFIQNS